MEYRRLGKTPLLTSVIGLGCSRLGASVFEDETVEAESLLHFAIDHGINFFDTADSYSYGNSECLLGKAIRGKRDQVILATKGGFLPSSLARIGQHLVPFIGPFRTVISRNKATLKTFSQKRQNFDVQYLKKALEKSLRRLGTDYIDLYQLHSPPLAILENGLAFRFLEQCQQEGKIRFYGISVNSIEDGLFCLQNPQIAALQVPINLFEQQAVSDLLPHAFPNTGILARVPLARGLLTEKAMIQTGPQVQNRAEISKQQQTLHELCAQEDRRISDVAIQFLLQFTQISSIIVGTKSVNHLHRNILAGQQPALSHELITHITSL
ncbi:MAG: aldo/keto reductase [Nitrospirales bacterium]|nr:MAG: aldo/keto reductase [Nitrospirales bacterium]